LLAKEEPPETIPGVLYCIYYWIHS